MSSPPVDSPELLASSPAESRYQAILTSLIAGGITGLIGVIRAISYAALIFSGSLAADLNIGVGIAVLSSAIISVVVALTSSLPGMIATPLAAPTVVLTGLAASIVSQIPSGVGHEAVVLSVVAAIALGSILTGLVLWLLGQLRWGDALDILPYPVVGGFMAGTGLLLVRGACKVMTGADLRFDRLLWLAGGDRPLQWGAGLAVAAMLLWATARFHHYLVMPAVLLLGTLLFYGAVWVYDLPLETVRSEGWLLGPFPAGSLWHPLTWDSLHQVQWGAIFSTSHTLGLLVFVSLLSLVLTNGSLELALEKDLDLNQELKAVGLANLAAGLGSTMAGNQALPSTLLVHRLGASSRCTGLFKAGICLAMLVLGPTFLNYFPKPILGSLLLYLGLGLLWQWLYPTWRKLPKTDYAILWATLVVINTTGFMAGIGVGFGLAALQFLIQCAQVQPVAASDSILASAVAVERPEAIAIAPLRGFLFFGTAKSLRQQLCDRLLVSATYPSYLLLDFAQVTGLDSSAVVSLGKLQRLAETHDCKLVFCHLSDPHQQQLIKSQILETDSEMIFPNRQLALAHCLQQLGTQPAAADPESARDGQTTGSEGHRPVPLQSKSLELSELLP